jgi:hypothetical protein
MESLWTLCGLHVDSPWTLRGHLRSQCNLKVINFMKKYYAMNEIRTWDLYKVKIDD